MIDTISESVDGWRMELLNRVDLVWYVDVRTCDGRIEQVEHRSMQEGRLARECDTSSVRVECASRMKESEQSE